MPVRYAEIDAILSNRRTRKMIKNVESNTSQYFLRDHFPLELRLKIKLSKHRGRPPDKSNDLEKPTKTFLGCPRTI